MKILNAHDRYLPEWFARIQSRQITLPRFQRFIAWGHNEISGLLTTVLRGLPSGATLILQVGDHEKFQSRTMMDAPETGEKVTEQLLDGQQRLTALWRSLNDKYEDRTYLIAFEDDQLGNGKIPVVYGQARWKNNGSRYPMWVDNPKELWRRGYIPVRLLRPVDMNQEINQWIKDAMPDDEADKYSLHLAMSESINNLRIKVREFNLPYLALPATTPKEVALDVFIKMNTSSVRLSTYDIIVALVEDETGKSLHEHVELLKQQVPRAGEYVDLPDLALSVVALLQDRIPNQTGYKAIDYKQMVTDWDKVVAGIKGMIHLIESESILDSARLPSSIPLPVIAALWTDLPSQPDKLGNAHHLLRKYLWCSFLTSRYEQSSSFNSLQDYRGLKRLIATGDLNNSPPIFNLDLYPLPVKEQIVAADWPKRSTILGRGLLALQLKCGAEDLADGARININNLKERPREYHHLFPENLLEDAGLAQEQIYRAMNCALISWRTNRTISDKDPVRYLKERADNATLGESELVRRLQTHLIPIASLSVGYDGLGSDERKQKIIADYQSFLQARADLLLKAVRLAGEGRSFQHTDIFVQQ